MTVNSKTKLGARIKHPKRRGEWAEMCFMMRAAELGLEVNKPWGESASYDFIVQKGPKMARVQVKSTTARRGNGYVCRVHNGQGPYHRDAYDFVAAYVILEDIWYIIPEKMSRGKSSIRLYPGRKWSKYETYREAWHELPGTSPKSGTVPSIEACAQEGMSFPFLAPGSHGETSQMLLAGV